MRTLPILVLLAGTACSGAGGQDQPKSAVPGGDSASATTAASAGKPVNKPGADSASTATVAEGDAKPSAENSTDLSYDDLPEIQKLDHPITAEAPTREIQRLGAAEGGKPAHGKP
jgi:hypothetical protein